MKVSVYIATSLDGYIARPNGSINWLARAHATVPAGEDCGFRAFMESVDTLVMGRRTFEQVLSFGEWAYGKTPIIVLSRKSRTIQIPAHLSETVSASSETPRELVRRLSAAGVEHLYVDGGHTIQGFLEASLVDEMTITQIPVAIGEGIPLFNPKGDDVSLIHQRSNVYQFGFVQSTYLVDKKAS